MKNLKSNGKELFTAEELLKKFKGKYIDIYPHHHEYWDEKGGKFGCGGYTTVYEVRDVSKVIKENFNLPEYCIQ